jgi:hypothetical protein
MAGWLRDETTIRQIDALGNRLRRHRGLAGINPEYRRALEELAVDVAAALTRGGLTSADLRWTAAGVDVVDVENFATWESELGTGQ